MGFDEKHTTSLKNPYALFRMMLFDLPEDLLVDLLSVWLQDSLTHLGRLDVACCNHASREHWLQVVRLMRINTAQGNRLIDFLTWLQNRGTLVNELKIRMKGVDWVDPNELASRRLQTTNSLVRHLLTHSRSGHYCYHSRVWSPWIWTVVTFMCFLKCAHGRHY